MTSDSIQALWIGPRLSTLGRLTIQSFLDHGYQFDLYGYQQIANTPPGTTLCDAAEIYPQSEVFVYRRGAGKGSPSAFSNLFRYRLLELKGGWWSDLDVVCLRPLEFDKPHVMGSERRPDGSTGVSNALFRMPAGSPLMTYCRKAAQAADRKNLRWGQIGPQLLTRAVEELRPQVSSELVMLPPEQFSPIDYWNIEQLITDEQVPESSSAIHLFNEMWRRNGLVPEKAYPSHCIYEQLIARYLGDIPRQAAGSSWLQKWFGSRKGAA